MESQPSPFSCVPTNDIGSVKREEDRSAAYQVDPFLLEALENPRHRLTVLRMELEIQQFILSTDQYQYEFQHFPTSYLRCAAHRVSQHYGLQTMSIDNVRVIVRKTIETKYPSIRLSDIPAKQPENEKVEQIKIVVRRKPNEASLCSASELGNSSLRTVEERMEEYDKARARIFSNFSDPAYARKAFSGDQKEANWNGTEVSEKIIIKDTASRIAIFRDREKDRSDPDYDRSYDRYASGVASCPIFSMGVSNICQSSHLMYDGAFSQLAFRPQVLPSFSAFGAVGCNQTCPAAVYMQWPTPAVMYAQSYDHFRNAIFQAPSYPQPLSLDHLQNS